MTLRISQFLEQKANTLIKLLPVIAFVVPFLILYFFPETSIMYFTFDKTWKGRTYYIFFIWLVFMEMLIEWDTLQLNKISNLRSRRTIAFIIALFLPTIFIISYNYYSYPSKAIVDWAWRTNISQVDWMPLHFEYIILAMLFILIIWLQYGIRGLRNNLIASAFMIVIGLVYLTDNIYREGAFTPFQIVVPTTANLAMYFLNQMGYWPLYTGDSQGMPTFMIFDLNNNPLTGRFAIGWPCAGVESIIIFTIVMTLFLKKSAFSWITKIIVFVIGAIVTYFVNILRIVTIFLIAIEGGNWSIFHDYYGQLYSVTWIISYLLIISVGQFVWNMPRSRRREKQNVLVPESKK